MIDLEAYFKRIGYDGPRNPTLTVLRELHELHPRAIPFENLDPLLGRPVRLDLHALQEKLVTGVRGGYCFEHNSLFAAVLRTLGFRVQEATGRVRWNMPGGLVTPRVHCLLLVDVEGGRYLADVGFGGNVLTGPLLLSSDEAQATPHGPFRLREEGDGRVLEAEINGQWAPLYAFDFAETHPSDLAMGNWFTSTHPNSLFRNSLTGARCEPGRRYTLRNDQLAVHRLGRPSERHTLTSAAEIRDVLKDLLAIRLDGLGGLDAALGRLLAGTTQSLSAAEPAL